MMTETMKIKKRKEITNLLQYESVSHFERRIDEILSTVHRHRYNYNRLNCVPYSFSPPKGA